MNLIIYEKTRAELSTIAQLKNKYLYSYYFQIKDL